MLHCHSPALHRLRTIDRETAGTRGERKAYFRARKAEAEYARKLRGLARQVAAIAQAFGPEQEHELRASLERYSGMIEPWARATATSMLADVSRRDEAQWASMAKGMARDLRDEIRSAPTGEMLRRMLAEQVTLIKSLPLDAAQRVHEWTIKGIEGAVRADEVAAQIMRTGEVTKGRANLIARTEVARVASGLVEARAVHVGSEGYIWRTSEDSDVRPLHRKLNGKFFRWDEPPVAGSSGERAHAGAIYNCRCWPDSVIPEEPA